MTNPPKPNLRQTEACSQAGQTDPATNDLTIQEIEDWDEDELLRWIQKEKPKLKPQILDKFKAAYITGSAFLKHADDEEFFRVKCQIPPGISSDLASLADDLRAKSNQRGGIKRPHSEEESSGQSQNLKRPRLSGDNEQAGPAEPSGTVSKPQKRLKLSLLPGAVEIYEAKSNLNDRPFLPAAASFFEMANNPGAIFADKTRFIPLLEADPFQYIFLHPRRWGKSTFLSILATYYNIKTKDSFNEIFGKLDIGKTPTKSRNSHLILLFDFSSIKVPGSYEGIKQNVFNNIS